MIDLKPLQGQVKSLVADLRGQVAADATLASKLRLEYAAAKRAERVGATFETWLDGVLDQAAVAWVLGCVFVRFCEDNELVPQVWIGGPEKEASTERALHARQAYIIANPLRNDRYWLREAFKDLRGRKATSRIFDEHNPVWRFDISGQAAEELFDFFRRGEGLRSLRTETLDTRFLGDLYQDLSTYARQTYALLQTPEFVEEFILDRAFTPALNEFGLPNMSVIDPTCGSGHFLLGAFHRLLALWREREPATHIDVLIDRALGQVTGVDINPFAVAIARFRLMVAALRAAGSKNLNNAYPVRVATGDSLLRWHQGELPTERDGEGRFAFVSEDEDLLAEYLTPRTYTVVLGNPPYITVKDKVLNDRYRAMYSACSGKYHLTVPFAQRFFHLAKRGDHDGDGAGYVGQITSNGFMKREFGKKLINDYFADQVELTEVIDASGAYIPSHGTPTVILVGRNRLVSPRYSSPIRAILGIRGEPGQPSDPAKAEVWQAITHQINEPGSESAWVSCADLSRERLKSFPWSLSGGAAAGVVSMVETHSGATLGDQASFMGFVSITAEDDAFFLDSATARRAGIESTKPMVTGDSTRDYQISPTIVTIFPYRKDLVAIEPHRAPGLMRVLWPNRRTLQRRKRFGTLIEDIPSLQWFEFGELYREKLRTPLSIAFAFVATHNHFVLDRGGKVFNRSAPVIKLPEEATEEQHLRLLGVLNSSTACFWLKQVSQGKGGSGIGRGIQPEDWMNRYEFTGTKLEEFPLPEAYPLEMSRRIDGLAQHLSTLTPAAVAGSGLPTRERMEAARVEYESVRARMISLQEELDWQVYSLYGLLDEDLSRLDPPEIRLGERAFEIVLARKVEAGETETQWFTRHNSTPITEVPKDWPDDYRELVERRIAIIESDRSIGLIERPECKRRWSTEGWDAMQTAALRGWLLDRLEAPEMWGGNPTPLSVAQIADLVRHDEDFRAVLDLWIGTDQHDLVKTLGKLVADEHVPFLAADRYKPEGLRKRAQWERTWALQRREDADETVEIAVPPKYASADFARPSFWRNRGKLDVPKERFVSYPKMGRDGDGSEVLGWAGWDHLAQARALAGVYLDRKTQAAWPAERLLPLLAGLLEVEPWLRQWHADPRPDFPGSPAGFFTGLIDTELAALGTDRAALQRIRGVEDLT